VTSYDIVGKVFTKATYQTTYTLDQQATLKTVYINADDYFSEVGNTDGIVVRQIVSPTQKVEL